MNLDMHLQTVKIQMRRLCIRIITVCLVNLIPIIQKYKKQGHWPNLADCPNLPDFTLLASTRLWFVKVYERKPPSDAHVGSWFELPLIKNQSRSFGMHRTCVNIELG